MPHHSRFAHWRPSDTFCLLLLFDRKIGYTSVLSPFFFFF